MAFDTFTQLNIENAAREFVLKALINTVHQIAPQAGLGPALKQMIDNSTSNMTVNGAPSEADAQAMRQAVNAHAHSIIDAGVGARQA